MERDQIIQLRHRRAASALVSTGLVLIIAGAAMLFIFGVAYDTTVETDKEMILGETVGGDRVYNLGLLQNRALGVGVGTSLLAVGLILTALGRFDLTVNG